MSETKVRGNNARTQNEVKITLRMGSKADQPFLIAKLVWTTPGNNITERLLGFGKGRASSKFKGKKGKKKENPRRGEGENPLRSGTLWGEGGVPGGHGKGKKKGDNKNREDT